VDAYLALVGKREVRRYEQRPIPDEVMSTILEAGRATGSSRNRQPWRFIVVTDPAHLRAVGALAARPANVELAPAAVVVAMLNPRAAFDAGRAAQNMMVAAWSLGVGSCPNTPTDEAALKRLLGLPDDAIIPTILSLGYPAADEPRPRPTADARKVLGRVNRLPLAEVVHRETYRPRGPQSGMALLAVLVILMVVSTVAASLIWSMDQQQARAGNRLRAVAALAAAEAGMHRALAALESSAPDGGLGRSWRPAAYSEEFQSGSLRGRFVFSIADQPGGAVAITSQGEIAGVTRRVRARVYLASSSMLAALYGAGLARIEKPPAQMIITTYGPIAAHQPWVHAAFGGGLAFGTTEAVINDPGAIFTVGPGPVDAPGLAGSLSAPPEPARLVLPRGVDLSVGAERRTVSAVDLRVMGVRIDPRVVWTEPFPQAPEIDRGFMQALAAGHAGNAALNEAAGKHFGDETLMSKRDSLYTEAQFAQIQTYLQTRPRSAAVFHGAVYVTGPVVFPENQRVMILDGSLVAEGTVRLRWGASVEIVHSAASRALPGLVALQQGVAGQGSLIVSQSARLRVHGLVHADGAIDVWEGARVDIVGAVASTNPDLSFRNLGGLVVIRYDPAILGTPGLLVGDDGPVIAWIASWEELP
jgi:nitroreductase/type II secretory pathway pseudopilin PulG